MADTFTCTENKKHKHDSFTGQPGFDDAGNAWYQASTHRVKAGYYEVPLEASAVCGAPTSDHPTIGERMTGQTEGYAIPEHSFEGDGDTCEHAVALPKLVGFLCIECGAPLEGMPTKDR